MEECFTVLCFNKTCTIERLRIFLRTDEVGFCWLARIIAVSRDQAKIMACQL